MKSIKRIFALVLIFVMALSITACHKKNETAVTVEGEKFTSAYYMCQLINAYTEAKNKVQEGLSETESTTEIDYFSKKVDKKDFVTWVKDTAMDNLKKIAAYKILCKKNKIEIPEEDAKNAESYASYYWSSYGYSAFYEPNGVSQTTYTQYMKDSYYSNLYFEHLYSKDGEKEIKADDVKAKIYDNFIIADVLSASFSEKSETEIATIKEKMNLYVTALTKGTMTFEAAYKELNGSEDDAADSTDSTDPKPKDKYAQVLGAADTAYASDDYDTVKALKVGEVKLVEQADNAGVVIYVKQDIKGDSYYIDNLDLSARHLIADKEYEETIENYIKDLKTDINKYAINQFNVKKIIEPQAQS